MTNFIFSVIIPMYNVEQYIENCLKSVFSQDFHKQSYEIIIVNDGSPDNSAAVAAKFCEKHENVKIITQENKGLGGARNTGIENATGNFLIFLDADDWLEPGAFSNLNKILQTHENIDVIEYGAGIFVNGVEVSQISFPKTSPVDGITYYFSGKLVNSACNKLYNREFLLYNDIKFIEKIYGEDFAFNTYVYYYAKIIISIDLKIINFFQSANSITRNNNLDSKKKYLHDYKIIIRDILRFTKDKELNTQTDVFFRERMTQKNATILTIFLKNKFSYSYFRQFMINLKEENLLYLDQKVNVKKYDYVRLFYKNFKNVFGLAIRLKQ